MTQTNAASGGGGEAYSYSDLNKVVVLISQDNFLKRKEVTELKFRLSAYTCVISCFRHEVEENCALLGYYTANSGTSLTAVSGQQIGPNFLTLENGTDRLSRNVGKELSLHAT